jgi:putative transcriptional regulator
MKNSIKVERAKNNLTQADLADKVGVSRQTINSIETGKFIPSTMLAFKIAHVFNEKIDNLFFLEEDDWDN